MQNLRNAIAHTEANTHLKGLVGSSFSYVLSETFKSADKPFLLIFDDKEEAVGLDIAEHGSEAYGDFSMK